MFSDQYEFLIEDFENKLCLIDQNKRKNYDLIDGDLKTFVRSLFEKLGKSINFRDIETRLNDLQKIDLDAISKAAELFNKKKFLECSFTFNSGKKSYIKDELDYLLKELKKMKKEEVKLGKTNLLLQLEVYTNSDFEQMICILGDKAPTKQLQVMIDGKLKDLSDDDIKILWSYIKEEFREKRRGFSYDKEILGADFFKSHSIDDLRKKIAQYLTLFRPQIIVKRFKAGQTASPIFSFGIARILGIHKHYVKDLNLNESMIIRTINRVTEFWENILYGKKDELYNLLGISPEGRIISFETIDDKLNSNPWFERNTTDRITCYKLVLCELRRLLKITDYYITRRAGRQHEKAGRDKQRTESDGTAKPEKAPVNLFQVLWLYFVQPLKGPWRLPVIIVILICGVGYAVWAVQTPATKERFLRFIGLDVQSIRVPADTSRSRDPESEEIRTKEQKTLPKLSLKEILNSADNFYKVEHFSKALLEYEKATDLVPFGVKVDLRYLEEARKNIKENPEKSCKLYRKYFEKAR